MKVVVGMSGGVDSAVAALLLKRAGHDVTGLFMKNWEDDDDDEYCSTREDLVDAVSAAERIGIDIEAVNFAAKYKAFLDHALAMGAEKIATGHYARLEERDGRAVLLKGLDPGKDQSYFLHRLTQAQLSRTLFPVGQLPKSEVRRIAREAG